MRPEALMRVPRYTAEPSHSSLTVKSGYPGRTEERLEFAGNDAPLLCGKYLHQASTAGSPPAQVEQWLYFTINTIVKL
jgi:hypothetical protein